MKNKKILPLIFVIGVFSLVSACNTQAEAPITVPAGTPTAILQPTETLTPTKTTRPTRTPTPVPEGVEVVKLRASDNTELVGYLHRSETKTEGDLVVMFAHGLISSHTEWDELEPLVFANGFSTMRFDFRGHGASSGSHQWTTLSLDGEGVINYLRGEGFEHIVCIGEGMGGFGCLTTALSVEIDGLVVISGIMKPEGLGLITGKTLQDLTIPKIFMIAEEDYLGPEFVEEFIEVAEAAPEPNEFYKYPGSEHALELFHGAYGPEILEIILNFFKDFVK